MGGSKSKSESGSAQKWARPYAQAGAAEVQSVYDANKDNLAALSANANDVLKQFQAGYTSAGKTGAKGSSFYDTVLSGKYLNEGNPYLQGIIDSTNKGVINNTNSQFTLAGRYGSGAHTDILANALAEAENQLRYGNYSDEMDRMMGAAEGSVAADAAKAQAQAAAAQTLLAQQALAAELPYTGAESLAGSLGQLFNGGTSTQKTSALGSIAGALGSVGGAAITKYSDPLLKDNVVKIGEYPVGLGVYEYSYVGSSDRDVGVMADEVAQLRPWALGPEVDGFMTVNYDALEMAA
jgi:hypothetical protein